MQRILPALAVFMALGCCFCVSAQTTGISITGLSHYTENRGWNEAGLGPVYQTIVTANVVPSGAHTLVFADNGGVPQPLVHLAQPATPNLYVLWRRFDTDFTGAWRIRAERGDEKSAPAWSPVLAKPQQVPLLRKVEVRRRGGQTRVSWVLPGLGGFDVDRIRVAIRGAPRMHGRFLSVLYVSGDLPPSAVSFTVPPGLLAAAERYVFEVALEDLEGGAMQNRSLTYSEPYVVPR